MFENVAEQFQKSFKPVGEIMTVNAKALEQLAEKQTALFTSLLSDSVTYAEGLGTKTDMNAVMEAQKTYAEGVQEKFVTAAKDSYAVMSETQEKLGELMKDVFTQAGEVAATAAPAAKPAKAAAKSAAKSAAK